MYSYFSISVSRYVLRGGVSVKGNNCDVRKEGGGIGIREDPASDTLRSVIVGSHL